MSDPECLTENKGCSHSTENMRQALNHKIRLHRLELAKTVEKEDVWRGPEKVIGKEGMVMVVKQGGTLREVSIFQD